MELHRFDSLCEAIRWYRTRIDAAPCAVDELFLTLCRGDDARAEHLYAQIAFPSRWWADITYMQGHYLLRLRRRDRLLDLIRAAGLGVDLPAASADPWRDIEAIGERVLARIARGAGEAKESAKLHCVLGHAHLAMDYHETATVAYRRAIRLDPAVSISWENMRLIQALREEAGLPWAGENR